MIGSLPLAKAWNWLAYLLFGLYASTIWVDAYWTYHLVNFGSSGVMLSPPTLSKTFGLISPEAMSEDSAPDAPARPEYLNPVAFSKAGPTIFSFRNSIEDA